MYINSASVSVIIIDDLYYPLKNEFLLQSSHHTYMSPLSLFCYNRENQRARKREREKEKEVERSIRAQRKSREKLNKREREKESRQVCMAYIYTFIYF